MEAVTPELALVDPELRRTAIACLDGREFLFMPVQVRPILRAAEPSVSSRSSARRAALLGVLAAGFLIATIAALDIAGVHVLLTGSTSAATAPRQPMPPSATDPLGGQGAVQRKLLDLILQSPSKRLPQALIDPQTGRPWSSLQTVCDPMPPGYQCVVRSVQQRGLGESVVVRYGVDGLTWLR